jgi:SNF2 family DNA or RNA helicase
MGDDAWGHYNRVIASLATARLSGNREIIEQIPYDLVIVDEAHHLKNRNSVSWRFVNALQKKYILFLTATPVQNKLDELYNLITVLKPGQLKTEREFRQQFVVRGDPRSPKNRGMLRELLADVMVRNTRAQVNIQLPRRRATTLRVQLTEEEQTFYVEVSNFVRAALADGTVKRGLQRLTLMTLQREIGSSPLSAAPTLEKMAKWPSLSPERRKQAKDLAKQAERVPEQAKAETLLKLLKESGEEKVIVFTHFLPTLHHLADRLAEAGVDRVVYHGGLSLAEKNQAINDFAGSARVLLSTEAAGEGRNLQFCWRMVNYDLPWNPMRIEQRIGRIHRIGQTHEVTIFNLAAQGTVEDYILQLLDSKINMFELVVGEMDMILGNLEEEREFEDWVFEVWATAQSQEEVEAGMEALGEALSKARSAYEETQQYDEALFGEDFGVE